MKLTKQTVVKQPSRIAGWVQLTGLLMFIFALANLLLGWVTNWIFVPAMVLYFYGMYLGARVTVVDEIHNDQPEN